MANWNSITYERISLPKFPQKSFSTATRDYTHRALGLLFTARCQRWRRYRHTMSPKYIHHLLAVRRTSSGGAHYFRGFSEIRWAHDRGAYDGELLHVLAT